MEISEDKVRRVLEIIDGGLEHGGGNMRAPGQFCVQQVLAVVFSAGLVRSQFPCAGVLLEGPVELVDGAHVGRMVSTLAMALNDQVHWGSPKDRAKGLRRLAVAELGSEAINQMEFLTDVATAFGGEYPLAGVTYSDDLLNVLGCQELGPGMLRDLANIAVDTLQQMGSPGCEFLYLCDEDKPIAEAAVPVESFPRIHWGRHLFRSLVSR